MSVAALHFHTKTLPPVCAGEQGVTCTAEVISMIKLLINNSDRAEMSGTSFGGKPVKNVDEDFHWPKCSCCKLPMQFLAKIRVDEELHQIFMCQNDPGMCDDWDANGGGNTKLYVCRNILLARPFIAVFLANIFDSYLLCHVMLK